MTLAVTVFLVHQVDLNIANIGPGPQIVLPHQPVEIDRGSRTGIDLIVGHFLDRAEMTTEFTQHPCGLFQSGAFRHIHNDLKFRFIVERQHFQHHQLEIRQTDRSGNQQQHAAAEQPAQWLPLPSAQKRPDHSPEQPMRKILLRSAPLALQERGRG